MKSRWIRILSLLAVIGGFLALPVHSGAATLPCRAVKLIVPWGAGGGTDVIFRVVARTAQKHLGKDIVVVNIGGQGGNKGAKEAMRAKANGCTLFAGHDSMQTSYVGGRVDFNYFGFEPVSLLTYTPSILGAHPGTPWKSAQDLVAHVKKNPSQVKFGATLGSTSHFFPVLVEATTGAKFKYVAFDGTRQRMTALLGKHIDLGELNITAAKKYIKSGQLKGLGIATEKRDLRLPDMPTLREQGIDVVTGINRGIFLPKGTPAAIVKMYSDVLGKTMADAKVRADLEAKGTIIQYKNHEEYTAFLRDNATMIERVAKQVGLYKRKN
ncbi:MAG: tripartite tricarboxylate transporter substrate binding protein [bacterium]|nr:tripartite tricarboxylate transporter substrate binding protein [bacterium]